eukprot:g693.t1
MHLSRLCCYVLHRALILFLTTQLCDRGGPTQEQRRAMILILVFLQTFGRFSSIRIRSINIPAVQSAFAKA